MLACLVAAVAAPTPANAQQQPQDEELAVGQQVFEELKRKGEIIESSPSTTSCSP
jgi:hypothetical protein